MKQSMSSIIIALLLCTAATAADHRRDFCSGMQQIGKAAMVARQAGVPLQSMLMIVSDATAIGIWKAAYEHPRESLAADQQESVIRFSELVLSECLKA